MSNPEQTEQDSTKKFSPFAGCSIFIIVGLFALGMILFTLWVATRMQEQVRSFTEENPQEIQLMETEGRETAQVDLKSKLVGFRHKIEAKHKGQMTLNAEEMNLAIATFDVLKPQRNYLWVREIQDDHIIADITYPVKDGIMSLFNGKVRYLNGQLVIRPELVDGAVFARIVEVRPSVGGNIPSEMRQEMSKIILHPLVNDKELGPLFKSLSAAEIKDGALVLDTDPDIRPSTQPSKKEKDSMLERFMTGFAIIAVIFLVIVTVIIFLSRRKAKQS